MRRAWPATERVAAVRRRTPVGRLTLTGLFLAVWAIALNVSLPLATTLGMQLSGGAGPVVYDLIPALTGRVHSGHGSADADHSLPVRADGTALLSKSETTTFCSAETPTAKSEQRTAGPAWAGRLKVAPRRPVVDHAHLSRAPPFVQANRRTV